MKITPLEIRQKTFEKVFRGYEKDEVNAYLKSLSMEWERLLDENKELYQRIENLETESRKLRELESSLFKTLKTAEDTGATLIEQAKKETDLKLKESNFQAVSILNDARSKAKNLIENADAKKKQILDEMINQVKTMEGLFNQMIDLKEKVVSQIKSYSSDLMGRIEKLEKKSEGMQIQDIVSEAKKIYNASIVGEGLNFMDNNISGPDVDKKGLDKVEESPIVEEESADKGNIFHEKVAKDDGIAMEVEFITKEKISTEEELSVDDELPSREETSNEGSESVEESLDQKALKENDEEQTDLGSEDIKRENKSTTKSFFDEID